MPDRLFWFWCTCCGFRTAHVCVPDVQATRGLLYRCTRCLRGSEHSYAEAGRALTAP